jgi:hypothetical protein
MQSGAVNHFFQADDRRSRQGSTDGLYISATVHDHVGFSRYNQPHSPSCIAYIDRLKVSIEHQDRCVHGFSVLAELYYQTNLGINGAKLVFLLSNKNARGPYNLSSPKPVSNRDFGKSLAKVMKRPYWLPIPAIMISMILGEMSCLILRGHYLYPKRLLESGFHFKYMDIQEALQDLLS